MVRSPTVKERIVDDKDSERLYYLGLLERPSYYILFVQYYEGGAIRAVSTRSGWTGIIDNMPVPSPNALHVAVSSYGGLGRYDSNRLTIWRVVGDALEKEWSIEPDQWGPGEIRWLDNNRLSVAQLKGREHHGSPITTKTLIVGE